MCTTLKLLDTVALQNHINANSALYVSADNRFCIIAEDGLYVLHLCGLMDSISPTISLKKLFITIPEYSPSSDVGINLNLFVGDLPQKELYETLLDLNISEKVRDSLHIKQQPVQAKWSPLGLISNNQCALGSLTNRGSLDIFIHTINEVEVEEYVSIVNITKCYVSYLKSSWIEIGTGTSPVEQLEEIKRRMNEILPTAFEWSHLIKIAEKTFCLLIVAHVNGDLTVWRIDQRKPNEIYNSDIKLIFTHKTDLEQITALKWQQVGNNGLLIAGNLRGKVRLIFVSNIAYESLEFGNALDLWNEEDNIKVENFKVLITNGAMYIIIVKGSFLLVCLINESGDILDMHNFHVGNFHISGLEHVEANTFLVLTHTGVIKQIKLIVEHNKLQIDWRYFYIDFAWHSYRTHGLIISPNKIFVTVLVSMAKINDIRRKKAHIKVLIFKNLAKDPLNILMKNSSDSLMPYWDCLEILRLNGIIERRLPCDGLPSGLNYDKLSNNQLKTCLWLAKSSETLYDKMYVLEEYNLLRSDELKYILKIKLACKHMKFLLEQIADGKKLDDFHMQSLDLLNMYLKEVVVDNVIPSLGLGKNTIDELYDVISVANQLRYPGSPKCKLCNENLIGTSCIPPHLDTRCATSLMQVLDLPYYKCPFCSSVVHWKLTNIYNTIVCPFCDVPMDLVSVIGDSSNIQMQEISTCRIDCTRDHIEVTDIEDHAFMTLEEQGEYVDLVAISSSDEEDSIHEDSATDDNSDIQTTIEKGTPVNVKAEQA